MNLFSRPDFKLALWMHSEAWKPLISMEKGTPFRAVHWGIANIQFNDVFQTRFKLISK